MPAPAEPVTDTSPHQANLARLATELATRGYTQPAWDGPRPLPPAPTRRQATPAHLLGELAAELRALGLDHLYATACRTEGVLSVTRGLTIWTHGHTLRCHTPLGTIPLPASAHAAARQLASLTGHTHRPAQKAPRYPSTRPPTPTRPTATSSAATTHGKTTTSW